MKTLTLNEVSKLLKEKNNFEILTHNYPDGDTLGCAYALCNALLKMGKNARVVNCTLPEKFSYLENNIKKQDFECEYVVSVDIASPTLMGVNREKYENRINLCIDHHGSNSMVADNIYVDSTAAAACEIIYDIICMLGVEICKDIANCIYTGISTDTGCFRYTNTTPKTHLIASELMKLNCDWQLINKEMFETKTRQKLMLERMVYDTICFFSQNRCALICITNDMKQSAGVGDDDLEGFASIPRQIEGVLIGITMRENDEGAFKISVRTNGDVDASAFCQLFGGGGHKAAAGCTVKGEKDEVIKKLADAVEKFL